VPFFRLTSPVRVEQFHFDFFKKTHTLVRHVSPFGYKRSVRGFNSNNKCTYRLLFVSRFCQFQHSAVQSPTTVDWQNPLVAPLVDVLST